jgi:hypothetical protein
VRQHLELRVGVRRFLAARAAPPSRAKHFIGRPEKHGPARCVSNDAVGKSESESGKRGTRDIPSLPSVHSKRKKAYDFHPLTLIVARGSEKTGGQHTFRSKPCQEKTESPFPLKLDERNRLNRKRFHAQKTGDKLACTSWGVNRFLRVKPPPPRGEIQQDESAPGGASLSPFSPVVPPDESRPRPSEDRARTPLVTTRSGDFPGISQSGAKTCYPETLNRMLSTSPSFTT